MQFYFILVLLPVLASFYIGWRFKQRFKKYSQIALSSGLSGAEVARRMLSDQGITGVTIQEARAGGLSDHYNPSDRTVNLSKEVYHGRSVAAAAVAAHECGHAVQHARAYAPLKLRSTLVPVVTVSSRWVQWIILAGIFTLNVFPALLWIGIALFATLTLFSIITLPVEFDASKRALAWLHSSNVAVGQENTQMKDALHWAAMTYVIAAIASIGTLLYYVMIASNRR